MSEQFEMYDDPFKMLILLATLISEKQGTELKYEHVPSYDNAVFSMEHERFFYKKDNTEITWFEFLGRDIASSRDLSRSEYNKMFVDCMSSLYNL
ncbi:hypothetical protein [Paenibacillus sp. 22594]|uniref:hypothetical protein n=1 Tax=Paenibacillus sp. 22594 TaxID=3453947 RepID=UPI003F82EEB8